MCRLFFLQSNKLVQLSSHLEAFSEIARTSERWQGDGWGIVYRQADGAYGWHRSLGAIWDEQEQFGSFSPTTFALSHARGAFGVNTKKIENTHPFQSGKWLFAFNGNIRGVRLQVPGSIGAKKIFAILLGFLEGNSPEEAILLTVDQVERNSQYIVGMNFILSDGEKSYVYCHWGEQESADYYAVRYVMGLDMTLVCSREYEGFSFERMGNRELLVIG